MRKLLICIFLAVGAHGQSAPNSVDISSTWRTGGNWNGRFWKYLGTGGEAARSAFVLGYTSGVQDAVFGFGVSLKSDFKEVLKLLFPNSLTTAEIVTALDRFYDTLENGPIAIVGAMKVIAQRANGADEATIQKAIDDLRSASGK